MTVWVVLERVMELSFPLSRTFPCLLLRGVLSLDQTCGVVDGEGAEFIGLERRSAAWFLASCA